MNSFFRCCNLVWRKANWFSKDFGSWDLMYWWKRLNSREQFKRANFSKSQRCSVRGAWRSARAFFDRSLSGLGIGKWPRMYGTFNRGTGGFGSFRSTSTFGLTSTSAFEGRDSAFDRGWRPWRGLVHRETKSKRNSEGLTFNSRSSLLFRCSIDSTFLSRKEFHTESWSYIWRHLFDKKRTCLLINEVFKATHYLLFVILSQLTAVLPEKWVRMKMVMCTTRFVNSVLSLRSI